MVGHSSILFFGIMFESEAPGAIVAHRAISVLELCLIGVPELIDIAECAKRTQKLIPTVLAG